MIGSEDENMCMTLGQNWTQPLKRLNHFKNVSQKKQKDELTMATTNVSFTNNTLIRKHTQIHKHLLTLTLTRS